MVYMIVVGVHISEKMRDDLEVGCPPPPASEMTMT